MAVGWNHLVELRLRPRNIQVIFANPSTLCSGGEHHEYVTRLLQPNRMAEKSVVGDPIEPGDITRGSYKGCLSV